MSFGRRNFSDEIAKKHVLISKRIHRDLADCRSDLKVYFGTHSNRYEYKLAEEDSGLEFWGIRLYASQRPSGSAIKHPDGIIADRKRGVAPNILEIKWGWVPGFDRPQESDLAALVADKGTEERAKIQDAMSRGKSCRVGKRKFPTELGSHKEDFRVTEETRSLLISDFYELMRYYPEYHNRFMDGLDRLMPKLIRLDYQQKYVSDFGVIQSFRDYISSPKE